MTEIYLALDFGGTKHSAATLVVENAEDFVNLKANRSAWNGHKRQFLSTKSDLHNDLKAMITMARSLLEGSRPLAVGVSFGGPVDFLSGIVRLSHHVPGWEDFPLAGYCEKEFKAPVFVDNDANVAALGEHRFGSGVDVDSLCYITVSTGVGSGWILNGVPWRGHDGMAGEIGHTVVDPLGPVCLCGKRGCVERLASGPYIAQDIQEYLSIHPDEGSDIRNSVEGNLTAITGKNVSRAAQSGDEVAKKFVSRAAKALGVGIGNAANLINPQRFIIGGGVSKSGDYFWKILRETARVTALPQIQIDIAPARLGDDSPLWGAVALAYSNFAQ